MKYVFILFFLFLSFSAQSQNTSVEWARRILNENHKLLRDSKFPDAYLLDSAKNIFETNGLKKELNWAKLIDANAFLKEKDYKNASQIITDVRKSYDHEKMEYDSLLYEPILILNISIHDFDKIDSICNIIYTKYPGKSRFRCWVEIMQLANKIYLDEYEEVIRMGKRFLNKWDDGTFISPTDIGNVYQYIGVSYSNTRNADSSIYFYKSGINHYRSKSDYYLQGLLYENLAGEYAFNREMNKSLKYMDSALTYYNLAKTNSNVLANTYYNNALILSENNNYREAFNNFLIYDSLRIDALENAKIEAVNQIRERYETEKKSAQINKLKTENLETQLEKERSDRNLKISLLIALILIILVGSFFMRNKILKRKNAIIAKERERSDNLLLNILPEKVANELKNTGKSNAQYFSNVSVLFTDFKNFTQLASKIPAPELLAELNVYFGEFDKIMKYYGIEKIKTIGDAYMAAGGLLNNDKLSVDATVQAALDMQKFVQQHNEIRKQDGLFYFEMRCGIHTGPVVAGIVGSSKFQYDIWGDTVNIAARMEQCGEIGKVNVSDYTAKQLNPELFKLESQTETEVKGKGHLKMHFVHS